MDISCDCCAMRCFNSNFFMIGDEPLNYSFYRRPAFATKMNEFIDEMNTNNNKSKQIKS